MTDYIAGVEIRHDKGLPPHTFFIANHPNSTVQGYGFASEQQSSVGVGRVQGKFKMIQTIIIRFLQSQFP
jgi:hypothetical protein